MKVSMTEEATMSRTRSLGGATVVREEAIRRRKTKAGETPATQGRGCENSQTTPVSECMGWDLLRQLLNRIIRMFVDGAGNVFTYIWSYLNISMILVFWHMMRGLILTQELDRVLIETDEDDDDRASETGEEDDFKTSHSEYCICHE
jgi:hypothetical protein